MTDMQGLHRDVISDFLALPSERSLRGIIRCLSLGIVIGILLMLDTSIAGALHFLKIVCLIVTGWVIAFFGWGAERLWYSTIGRMFAHPLKWYAYLSRIPFWFIGGGISYTLGLLVSEKSGFLSVQDIPVRSLFISGGCIGLFMQCVLQYRMYRFIKSEYPMERGIIERSNNDEN
jgi:hypothetical protein